MRNRTNVVKKQAALARRSLIMLARSIEQLADSLGSPTGRGASGGQRRRLLNPKQRAFLKLQGQYLGLSRHLTPRQKTEIRAIREKKGYQEAIKRAQRLVRKGKAA